jgi:two-component system chemotaxis response regulator CheY
MQSLSELTKPRILVADDDSVIRHLVCSVVKSEGYEVVVAEDGLQALRILQTDTDFKGAIFDMMMPHIQGIDVIRHMRTEKRFMRIPVMLITSEQDIHLVGKTFAAGATLFLLKPFTNAQLKSMLHMLVSQSVGAIVESDPN